MQTYLVEVLDEKAVSILQNLEDQHIIRIVSQHDAPVPRLSEQFRASIPAEIGLDLHRQLGQMRNEW